MVMGFALVLVGGGFLVLTVRLLVPRAEAPITGRPASAGRPALC
jgi:hypothetical protein